MNGIDDHATFELDTFGQNPRLSKLYTQLCFAFSLPDTGHQSQQNVVDHLRQGLRTLSTSVPWLAGNVVQDRAGVFKIETGGELPELILKDARHELPSFEEYRRAKFPFSMLDEKVIASRSTVPVLENQHAPVLSLQLTFIEGGLLLVFSGQHNCMDMRGQSVLMHLIAKACRGDPLSEEERKVVDLRGDGIILNPNLESATTKQDTGQSSTTGPHPSQDISVQKSTWVYFNFSSATLSTLKATAAETITTDFVSTDDVLSAFIWQAITRVRLDRFSPADDSTFERQVDVRKHLGLPSDYVGNAVHKASSQMPARELLAQPLGIIASQLRGAISADQNLGHMARAAATRLSLSLRKPMPTPAPARATLPSTVIKMSSWAKEQCSTFDFGGPLGIAEAVRRPKFDAWEGLAYMMPKALNGDIAVALCLRDTDLGRLRSDDAWTHYCEYVG